MHNHWLPLVQQPLAGTLVREVEAAALAIGRLDARASASFHYDRWRDQAALAGFASALRAQGRHVEESHLFSDLHGVPLPNQVQPSLTQEDRALLEKWQSTLQHRTKPHWRELVHAPAEMPAEWTNAPALLRVLALAANHAQFAERAALPIMPQLLQALGLSQDVLPSLVIIDPAWRHWPRDLAATTRRSLRELTGAALHGLKRLNRIEADYRRGERVLREEARAGALGSLIALIERDGIVTPRGVTRDCQLSISGAGKLLSRAARLGLVVEVSGRTSWRTYLSPQLATQFGYVAVRRGRPPSPAPLPPPLASTWRAFDDEMAAIDAMLARFGPAKADLT